MSRTTDFLICIRQVTKLHDDTLKSVCIRHGLSRIEANIISFLYNNPDCDTAADIAELRMLSKGNVSRAVENLIRKSLLKRTPDRTDRRKIHLSLLPAAAVITEEIERVQKDFLEQIFTGFSDEEIRLGEGFMRKILINTAPEKKEG